MRKVLIVTAAALAAVIFFLLLTLPSRPVTVPAADGALAARAVAGAYHIHTVRSDGAGDRAAVAKAAAQAGLKFVIITDHGDATRGPERPAYISGVLCIDGVEVSTRGGHYVALGIGGAPYPLGGEAEAVVEDVARLGGFGIAAHPDSPRPELSWTDWAAPVEGLEWVNADSEWRNETRTRLARVLFDYFLRPGPALAAMLDRPVATLTRWDELSARRPVVGIGGHDAHGGMGRSAEYRGTGPSMWVPGIPSYEASFRSFSTRVVLERPLSGTAEADAAAVTAAIRAGRMFTAVDALAAPGDFEYHAVRGPEVVMMGSVAPPGPAAFEVAAAVPPGARTVLLRNGQEVASAAGGGLRVDTSAAEGAYHVEIHLPGAPGDPPVPWILGNPIYFLDSAAAPRAAARSAHLPLSPKVSWHVEKDRGSSASVVPSAAEVAFFYRLRGPGRGSQFAAAVADLQGRAPASAAIAFSATAARPARLSVQLRYRGGGGARWGRSVYVDSTPREIVVPIDRMRPADRQEGPAPSVTAAVSLLFVVDLTNALPGAANTIRISRVGFSSIP